MTESQVPQQRRVFAVLYLSFGRSWPHRFYKLAQVCEWLPDFESLDPAGLGTGRPHPINVARDDDLAVSDCAP